MAHFRRGMSDEFSEAFGKVLQIGHPHFFCHFADRKGGGLQKHGSHVHLVI